MISKARVGENRPSVPTTAWPKYRLGSSAPIRPLAWVQSVGVQKISPFWGNQFCDATKPGRLPIRALWGSSTPFGASVASEPANSKAGVVDLVGTSRNSVDCRASNERHGRKIGRAHV